MTTRQHALFDAANLGPDLGIIQGGEVIEPLADSLSTARTARGTVSQSAGIWSVEFMAWGLVDDLSAVVGIVTADASLSVVVGGDAYGIGYDLATGEISSGASVLDTVATAEKGDIIGVQFDGAEGLVRFLKNGALLVEIELDSSLIGETFFPAASLGSDAEGDGRVFMNAGQRAFEFPLADSDGWYSIPVTIDTMRFADGQSYFTAESDGIPNAEYHGIVASSSVTIVRALNFWPWGGTGSRGTAAQFVLLDPDGEYDALVGANVRDLEVTIHEVADAGVAFADADLVGSFVLERVDVLDDCRKRITLRDRTAVLDQPAQSRLFLPNLPEDVANRPLPIRIGVCRSVEPILISDGLSLNSSQPIPVYQVSDSAVAGFGLLRDKGDPLALGADWTIDEGQQRISLVQEPLGKLTADISSVGGAAITNLAPQVLSDWDTFSNVTEDSSGYVFGNAAQTQNGTIVSYLQESAVLTAGRTYGFVLTIDSMTQAVSQTGVPVRVSIGEGVTSGPNGLALDSPAFSATQAGVYSGAFTAVATGPVTLALRGILTATNAAVVSRFDLFETANTEQDTLQPITLEGFARELLQQRGGLVDSQWSAADAAAIDAATGYGLGFSATDPVSVGEAVQAALVGFTACYWQDRDGVIRFSRLVDPASLTPTGEITQDLLLSDLAVTPDQAPGLAAQMAGRRNWAVLDPTDFVTDFVEVPLAVRKTLSRQFRSVKTTGVPFPAEYAHARGAADPVATLIDEPESLQAEIDRVASLYQTVRFFYQADVPIEALESYELGQTWTITYPRYGLSTGKACLLVAITEDRINRRATLRFWG